MQHVVKQPHFVGLDTALSVLRVPMVICHGHVATSFVLIESSSHGNQRFSLKNNESGDVQTVLFGVRNFLVRFFFAFTLSPVPTT